MKSVFPTIRVATPTDRAALRAMQETALRHFGRGHYSPASLTAFIEKVGTMDDALLDEGRYFVAIVEGRIIGCGGWSLRLPGYASKVGLTRADATMPTVRSVYVDPAYARRGIASTIMAVAETGMQRAGYRQARLTATRCGLPLYERLGYLPTGVVSLDLGGGLRFNGVSMQKSLVPVHTPLMALAA